VIYRWLSGLRDTLLPFENGHSPPLSERSAPVLTGQPYQVIKDEDSGGMILTPIELSEVWNQMDSMNLKF
jgi:hypothetical protein